MISILDIKKIMDKWAPPDTAESWDNVGIQIGDPSLDITEIIIALEVDESVLAYLQNKHSCCVITHHPLLFKPLKRIRYDQDLGRIIQVFSQGNHQLFSAHTNLDYAKEGVNDCLIEQYGLKPKQGQPMLHGFGKFFDNKANIGMLITCSAFSMKINSRKLQLIREKSYGCYPYWQMAIKN